jgi:hypothetical protein
MFAVAIGVFRYLSVRRVQLEFNECFALLATANARVAPVLSAAVPYRIHTVLTDNGIQFADLAKNRKEPTARFRGHPFEGSVFCTASSTGSPNPIIPGPNGQVERMNRTIKEATVQRYHYDSHDQLRNCAEGHA